MFSLGRTLWKTFFVRGSKIVTLYLTFTGREYYLQQRNQYERQECTRIHTSSTRIRIYLRDQSSL